MKKLILSCLFILQITLIACGPQSSGGGSGSTATVTPSSFSPEEVEMVLQASGVSVMKMAALVTKLSVAKNQNIESIIAGLDQKFNLNCAEFCRVRLKGN